MSLPNWSSDFEEGHWSPEYSPQYESSSIYRTSSPPIPSSPPGLLGLNNDYLTGYYETNEVPDPAGYPDEEYNPSRPPPLSVFTTEELAFHEEIKARAHVDTGSFTPLPCVFRDIQLQLPETLEILQILVRHMNLYADANGAREPGRRYWYPVSMEEMEIFMACSIYMGIYQIKDTGRYWRDRHRPMKYIAYYRFEQIKRFFHICEPGPKEASTGVNWYQKFNPVMNILRAQFKKYVIPPLNVAIDEMVVAYTGKIKGYPLASREGYTNSRNGKSAHTLKFQNKLIHEGYKIWGLCFSGYVYEFLPYSRKHATAVFEEAIGLEYHLCHTSQMVLQVAQTPPISTQRFRHIYG
ncbi:hypothetical protein G7Y89_g4329 [Cudoniella acicularis]|uniref:PiggyBac transposable element-derived protein domain-containing protein n=1 Tax=Cudoniella acicularis TaxID=354080 RepID=A0A8H4W4E1_9HELO|nr:hypothetical protein G7Y89_g4329 [Cudoniella acicularis]